MKNLKNKFSFLVLFYGVISLFMSGCDKNDDAIETSTTFDGNVFITNQTELEDFASFNYKKINGHLKITGVNSLTSLMELSVVFTLEIYDTQLDNLQGLNNLHVTGEDTLNEEIKDSQIIIRDNKALSTLDGIANTIIIDYLTIRNNVNLFNFCALKNVEVLGFYNVEENWLNPTTNELKNSTTCQKEIYRNPNCSEEFVRKIFLGDITIENQQELIDFGNQQYTDIEGVITIFGVNSLEPIEGVRLIDELVIKNTTLKNLDELKCLAILNSLQLIDNPLLENLEGLSNTKISQPNVSDPTFSDWSNESGTLVISNNDALLNLEGLENMEYLLTVLIENNDKLTSIKALSNLIAIRNPGRDCEYVNGDFLKILNNDMLLNLQGLENMSVLHLYLHDNDALIDLNGLSKISSLELLSIKNNEHITSLNGLNNISRILNYYDCFKGPGQTIIIDNPRLNDFCKMKNVDFDYPYESSYQVSGNAYNPTLVQIKTDDGCSN